MRRLDVTCMLGVVAAARVLELASRIEAAPPELAEQARRMFNINAPTTWRALLWSLGCGLEDKECPEA